jgi:hypothetical protein
MNAMPIKKCLVTLLIIVTLCLPGYAGTYIYFDEEGNPITLIPSNPQKSPSFNQQSNTSNRSSDESPGRENPDGRLLTR